MRVTSNIIQQAALRNLQSHSRQLFDAQQKVSTGLRIQRPSEDVVAAEGVMEARSSLAAIDQYRRNVSSARSRADAEEGVLSQLTLVLDRARELAMAQSSSTATTETRKLSAPEARQLYEHAMQLANTRLGGRYLFGGAQRVDTSGKVIPPASDEAGTLEVLAAPAADGPEVEIASGVRLQPNHHVSEVFGNGSEGVLAALARLASALESGSQTDTDAALGALNTAFGTVQGALGEMGARISQLEVTSANLEAVDLNLRTMKSDLQEADLEAAVTEMVTRQTAYQAAMMATSRVMGMTLTDYLR